MIVILQKRREKKTELMKTGEKREGELCFEDGIKIKTGERERETGEICTKPCILR